jgi:predicted RNA-binding protein (virulence factor B family)
MDLLTGLSTVHKALEALTSNQSSGESWASSEEAFEQHFGASYAYFKEILGHLSPEQNLRFERTLQINPEAAILWILAMEAVED